MEKSRASEVVEGLSVWDEMMFYVLYVCDSSVIININIIIIIFMLHIV